METLSPAAEHTHTIIFLHGRDSVAKEFADEFFESEDSGPKTLPDRFPSVKWVFPTAELLQSTRFDCETSQWFDMYSTEDPHENEDAQELASSISRIQDLVAREAAIIGHENVFLGGISQGCAVAIHALLGGQERLGGFIGLCSWLPKREAVKGVDGTANQAIKTPILLCHARDDDVINISFGEELRDTLASIGMKPRWCEYADGGHWVNEPQGVDDIVAFLKDAGVPSK
ncbi:alpha beta-hydrolase [Lecanosticta acicola]|uniref:Alpha beta-hydrolase n=1 Tax=Lecanosticta acicola TaxID=111012 RepID=A0AAI8YR54_9PEZI|nr:alpha beta-hydrolase [Lecanosticta acicola]